MFRLLYVSRSCLPEAQADGILDGIVAVSHARNACEGITGALMFTGASFAGVLEGERDAVLALTADIAQDRGHHDVWIAQEGIVKARQYDRWSVAYRGRSTYSQRLVESVRTASDDHMQLRGAVNALSRFIRECVRDRVLA